MDLGAFITLIFHCVPVLMRHILHIGCLSPLEQNSSVTYQLLCHYQTTTLSGGFIPTALCCTILDLFCPHVVTKRNNDKMPRQYFDSFIQSLKKINKENYIQNNLFSFLVLFV